MRRASGEPVRSDRGGIGYLLNQAARGVRAKLAEELRLQGLDDRDYIVLRGVMSEWEKTGAGVLTSGIAESLKIQLSDVDDAALRLGRNGWVEVAREGGALRLAPSQKATTIMPGLQDTARWSLEHSLNGFARDEIEQLTGYLARIVRNTNEAE